MASANCTTCREIKTFVFLDLETTDIIRGNVIPEITEVALVALSREALLNDAGRDRLPRVLHKMLIPVKPTQPIPQIVTEITSLDQHLLEDVKVFDNLACELIKAFLNRLQGPVCLVAHNGNQFDYSVLLHALKMIRKVLPRDILSVDSWIAFRELLNVDNVFCNSVESDAKMKTTRDVGGKTVEVYGALENYKLSSVYQYLVGRLPLSMHTAEDDCLSLLICAMKIANPFVSWADREAKPVQQSATTKRKRA